MSHHSAVLDAPSVVTHVEPRHAALPRTRLGGLTLALGTLGTVFGVVPFTFMLAVVFGVLGLVSSWAGLHAAHRGQSTDERSLHAGTMLSVLAITLGAVGYLVLVVVTEDLSMALG